MDLLVSPLQPRLEGAEPARPAGARPGQAGREDGLVQRPGGSQPGDEEAGYGELLTTELQLHHAAL